MKELSSIDITNIFNGKPLFGGVINKDDLKHLGRKVYIVNLDTRSGNGSHWTMISNINPHSVDYFDSFGIDMPEHLLSLAEKTGKQIHQNHSQYQMIKSNSCGEFCVYVANELMNKRPFTDILSDFSKKLEYNEKLLNRYIKRNFSQLNT